MIQNILKDHKNNSLVPQAITNVVKSDPHLLPCASQIPILTVSDENAGVSKYE